MSERLGTVQGPGDIGTGKRIGNAVVTLPAGTVLTNADGTTTTLASDTPVFLQRVVLGDPLTLQSAEVRDAKLQVRDSALDVLERIAETLEEIQLKISNL
jgi:hypothetical protein